jgi:hypothetical protein
LNVRLQMLEIHVREVKFRGQFGPDRHYKPNFAAVATSCQALYTAMFLVDSLLTYGVTSSGGEHVDVNESGSNRSIGLLRRRLEGSVGRIRSKLVNSHTTCVSKTIGSMWNEHTHQE